jgi:alkanesulfonate monooxygenase SsuD/methylene tetrahydromethanopterin reductase-like flavin-dependent oxidoreductase (luciferase family)
MATTVMFDMRAPDFGAPARELYAAALDMCAFSDEIGVDRLLAMEHHGSEDGYLPAPFVLGGGIAARTRRARLLLSAVILPLHDPVKIAEQIAVLDLMSAGRLEVVFGAGYVPSEFARFKISLHDRAKLMDQGIEIILRALHGERFNADGREVFVRPLPIQKPEDIISGGGGVPASARRAARFGIGFFPMSPHLVPIYEEECRKLGRTPRPTFGNPGPLAVHLAEDPEKGWSQLERHFVHMSTAYAKWADEEGNASTSPFKGLDNKEAIRKSGIFAVWTPDEAVKYVSAGVGLSLMPLIGGLSPKIGWECLELLKTKVLPRLG